MREAMRGRAGMALAFLLGLVIATAGTATAARLITGKQIKDGSVSSRDLTSGVRAQIARAGTPGPRGARGETGLSNGPAGGDLTGTYPDPKLRRPVAVPVREPGPTCLVNYDILCSDGAGNSWTQAGNADFAPISYYVEPGGFIQFQGAVQRVGAGFGTAVAKALLFYLPPGRRPVASLRFPVVSYDHQGDPNNPNDPVDVGHLRVGGNGEVALFGFRQTQAGDRFDLSGVRFRVADPVG